MPDQQRLEDVARATVKLDSARTSNVAEGARLPFVNFSRGWVSKS